MNDLKISKPDLYSELRNPPNSYEMGFNNWYNKNIKELRVIQKTKKGVKVIVIILSALLFILSVLIEQSGIWVRIFQVMSFTLMTGIWIFMRHETINPEKNLSIMRILYKSINNSKD